MFVAFTPNLFSDQDKPFFTKEENNWILFISSLGLHWQDFSC